MSAIDKIYTYFDREPDLKVLFIFNDEFLADELREVQWKEGYRATALWTSRGIGSL